MSIPYDLLTAGAPEPDPAHTYTFLFCDLLTDELIAELPLRDVSYSLELNGIGALRAFVPYTSETLPLLPDTATTPARTAVYVDRDGVIVWGGIIWTRTPAPGGKSIQAAEFLSYYQRRYVTKTLSNDTSAILDTRYVPDGQRLYQDQKYIVWSLLRWAEVQPSGDIGIDLNGIADTPTGITRSTTYWGHERHQIYKAITDLAASEDGFDFGVEVGWSNSLTPYRYRRARIWYPRRGRTAAASGLVFTTGGPAASILDWSWPEDGTSFATETHALGAGNGEAKLVSVATASDLLSSGWPLLQQVASYDGVVETSRLQSLANADLAASSQAQVQPWFEVTADGDPAYGTYEVGDVARFVIEPEDRMPAGREGDLRIVSIDVTASHGPERVRLTCAAV